MAFSAELRAYLASFQSISVLNLVIKIRGTPCSVLNISFHNAEVMFVRVCLSHSGQRNSFNLTVSIHPPHLDFLFEKVMSNIITNYYPDEMKSYYKLPGKTIHYHSGVAAIRERRWSRFERKTSLDRARNATVLARPLFLRMKDELKHAFLNFENIRRPLHLISVPKL